MFDEALDRLRGLGESAATILPGLLLGILLSGLGLFVVRGVRAAVTRAASRREASTGSAAVLDRIAGGVVMLVVFLIAAAVAFPSVSAADLFSLLGIGGVAIGFAFRDVLQNLLAGILIPNASLFTDKIEVITAYEKRRLQFALTMGNDDDIAHARDVVVQALRSTPGVLEDPAPEAMVTGLGTADVDMAARFWVNPPRRRSAMDPLDGSIEADKLALTEAGLDLPYPTTQILFHDQTEKTDGDRACQREGWPAAWRAVPRPRWQAEREAAQVQTGDRQ